MAVTAAGLPAYGPAFGAQAGVIQQKRGYAPSGMEYDAATGQYKYTPQMAGQRAGQALTALEQYGPSNLLGSYQAGGAGGYGGGFVAPGIGTRPPETQTLTPADLTASQAAQFARAKDLVGQQTRGALTGLAGAMAGRGTVGSGVEGRGQQQIIQSGQQQLGEVARQQAMTSADIAQKQAELAYQGGITQRGQDIGAAETYRGQDIQRQQAQAQLALQQQQLRQQALQGLLSAMGGLQLSY